MVLNKNLVQPGAGKTYFVLNYGCQMNESDAEHYAGQLEDLGYTRADDFHNADVIVVNTCCVRESAEKRILGKIGELKRVKENHPGQIICVAGCMAQKDGEKLIKKHPQIDLLIGTAHVNSFKEILESFIADKGGRERSRSIENIVEEVEQAVANGYKEFTLLGQNVNSYGKDFGEKGMFAKLLRRVNDVPGVERIRYMTSHPRDMGEDVIQAVAECEHICENFHVPFQAGSSRILKMMNRGYTREQYLELVKMIRRYVPDAAVTTDIIVGFPGETEEDFEETLSLVKEVGFDAAYTFIYSKRSGTPAAKMEGQVPLDVKKARLNRLMAVQNENSLKRNEEMVGKTYEVLAEGPSANNPNVWSGRTRTNKLVLWPTEGRTFTAGQKVNVKICNAQTWLVKGQAE